MFRLSFLLVVLFVLGLLVAACSDDAARIEDLEATIEALASDEGPLDAPSSEGNDGESQRPANTAEEVAVQAARMLVAGNREGFLERVRPDDPFDLLSDVDDAIRDFRGCDIGRAVVFSEPDGPARERVGFVFAEPCGSDFRGETNEDCYIVMTELSGTWYVRLYQCDPP